jgi:hypothetical protein
MAHIRLTPYNENIGALARRFSVGGQLFIENQWYEVSDESAELLKELVQGTGCPYFQIIYDKAEWTNLMRRELAAAVAGPGAAALAELFAAQPQVITPPKKPGEMSPSKFDGLEAKEISDIEGRGEALASLRSVAPLADVAAVLAQTSPADAQAASTDPEDLPDELPAPKSGPAKPKRRGSKPKQK